jgi:hypothetical protein
MDGTKTVPECTGTDPKTGRRALSGMGFRVTGQFRGDRWRVRRGARHAGFHDLSFSPGCAKRCMARASGTDTARRARRSTFAAAIKNKIYARAI